MLFNIYLDDLFYILSCDVCNFADDTTPYVCDKNFEFVLTKLENHFDIPINWFEDNYMKMNSDKCHLFISSHKFEHLWAKIGNDKIWETGTVKPSDITIHEHLNNVCLKTNRKLSALMRTRKLLVSNKTRMLFKGFFESQFKYCPLLCMFYSRNTSNRTNLLHERALRLVYNDYELPFEKPLEKDGSFTVHHYNIQTLCIELCHSLLFNKVAGISPATFLKNRF